MIHVTTCGFDSNHKKPCNIEYNLASNEYLALFIKKEAWYYLDGIKKDAHPNMVIIYPPNSHVHYGCDIPGYNDDWIHFSLKEDDINLFDSLSIPLYKSLYPYDFYNLSKIVEMMSRAFHRTTVHSGDIINNYMHLLLYSLSDQLLQAPYEQMPKYFYELSRIRTEIYNAPANDWQVSELSNKLFISVSHFQHLYKSFFDTSCQKDVIKARIKLSQFYLVTTDMSIHEIADNCGYDNELHFMRQFKKNVGITPTEYRINNKS